MRITIIAIGSRGDVQPYVALGTGLRRAGHDVRLATHPRFAGLVRGEGLELAPVAEGDLSRGRETDAGRAWLRGGSRVLPNWAGMLKDGASVAERRLHDCWAATEGADAIVTSILGTLLGLQMARERDVPLLRAYYGPPGRIAHAPVRQAIWLCSRPWVNRARRAALDLPPLAVREPFGQLDRERAPLLYGYSAAVAPAPPTGDVTGYWLLDTPPDWTPPTALSAFLAAGDPPVLVSFGTMADRQPERTTELLLEALSRAGRRGILIRGPHLAPDAALGSRVLAIDATPYDWLFPLLAAVVHHGGAGTTAYALRAGVPSVAVPAMADQPFWAARIHALGVGPAPIPRNRLTAAALADAIRVAATDPGIRARSAALAERIAGEDGVGVAVAAIERHLAAKGERIGTRPRPACPLCSARGALRHDRLHDRLFGVPGAWSLARCPAAGCGALWLDPAPVAEDIGKAYRNYYTHAHEPPPRSRPFLGALAAMRRAHLRARLGYPARADRLAAAAAALLRVVPGGRDAMDDTACHLPAPAPGARLLEVGFGTGDQLVRMRELGWQVSGVDIDPVVVAAARERGLDVHHGELAARGFPDGCFDAVYLSHVVEHVLDPVALLRECCRVLAPGGRLVAITPNVESRGHGVFGADWFGLDPPRHLVLFSPAALRAAATAAGFA
ncbi:MAG TPA: methyltransferase domain-containing protein, partial [Solirubrobacteraceae bacterium]|nr:methyltransferase domain-containing protein [Solirubrobacteraceae bacterium]